MKPVTLWDYLGRFVAICLIFALWYVCELIYSWVSIIFEKPARRPKERV